MLSLGGAFPPKRPPRGAFLGQKCVLPVAKIESCPEGGFGTLSVNLNFSVRAKIATSAALVEFLPVPVKSLSWRLGNDKFGRVGR